MKEQFRKRSGKYANIIGVGGIILAGVYAVEQEAETRELRKEILSTEYSLVTEAVKDIKRASKITAFPYNDTLTYQKEVVVVYKTRDVALNKNICRDPKTDDLYQTYPELAVHLIEYSINSLSNTSLRHSDLLPNLKSISESIGERDLGNGLKVKACSFKEQKELNEIALKLEAGKPEIKKGDFEALQEKLDIQLDAQFRFGILLLSALGIYTIGSALWKYKK